MGLSRYSTLAARGDLRFDRFVVGRVAELDSHAGTRQELEKQLVGAAIRILHRDDPVAGLEQCEQRVADRRHPGRKARNCLCTLELAYFLFEDGNRGVRVPPVNVAGALAARYCQPVVNIAVAERDAVYYWNLGCTLHQVLCLARPHGLSAPSEFVRVSRVVHTGLSSLQHAHMQNRMQDNMLS